MTRSLILVRGLPGSGKNTFAELMAKLFMDKVGPFDYPVLSADDYFMTKKGYEFDKSKIKSAHDYCHKKTLGYMKIGRQKIFVANTFTEEWEMEEYYKLAKKYDYTVFSIIIENRHDGKNVHDVPKENIEAMKNRFNIKL